MTCRAAAPVGRLQTQSWTPCAVFRAHQTDQSATEQEGQFASTLSLLLLSIGAHIQKTRPIPEPTDRCRTTIRFLLCGRQAVEATQIQCAPCRTLASIMEIPSGVPDSQFARQGWLELRRRGLLRPGTAQKRAMTVCHLRDRLLSMQTLGPLRRTASHRDLLSLPTFAYGHRREVVTSTTFHHRSNSL